VVVDLGGREIMAQRALEALSGFRARHIERVLEGLHADVVLFPQQAIFPKRAQGPCVLVVHDLNHLYFPRHLSLIQRLCRNRSCAYALERADRVISDSNVTRQTIFEKSAVDPAKVVTVPLGFKPVDCRSIEPFRHSAGEYLYYPATTKRHKNHALLFETVAAMRSRGQFPFKLILSGIVTPHWKALRKQIGRLGLEDVVEHLGYVPYEQVWSLYRGATAVLFPTAFEGFGLPVLEAAGLRTRVIVSRLEIFKELGVPDRFRIDFEQPGQLLRALAEPGPTELEKTPLDVERVRRGDGGRSAVGSRAIHLQSGVIQFRRSSARVIMPTVMAMLSAFLSDCRVNASNKGLFGHPSVAVQSRHER